MEVHPQEGKKQDQTPPQQLRTYKDTVSIVTGAASGIGRALVEELAAREARAIILVDRQVEVAQEVASKCNKGGAIGTKVYDVDVRSFEDLHRVVTETMATYGRVDYMFNNAGVVILGSVEQIGREDFNYNLDVNIGGVVNGVHAVYPVMKKQSFGHIVNTASIAGLFPQGEGWTAYGTTKFAVVGLTKNLRIEAARHGVKVSAFCPGLIDTPIIDGGVYGKIKSDVFTQEALEDFKKQAPFLEPRKFASKALDLVLKNKPIIVVPGWPWKLHYFIHRIFPNVGLFLTRKYQDAIWKKLEAKHRDEGREIS